MFWIGFIAGAVCAIVAVCVWEIMELVRDMAEHKDNQL